MNYIRSERMAMMWQVFSKTGSHRITGRERLHSFALSEKKSATG